MLRQDCAASPNLEQSSHRPPSWLQAVVWIWAVAVLAADLKVTVWPYIHWALSVPLGLLVLPLILSTRARIDTRPLQGAALLIIAVALCGFWSPNPGHDLVQTGKLAIILLFGLWLFLSRTTLAHTAFRACIFSVYLNLALLLLGLTLSPTLASMKGIGRWGTFLNFPGSLWRVGISVLLYAAYLLLTPGRRNISALALLLASLLLIFFDGSRTALIVLAIGVVYLLAVLWKERLSGPRVAVLFLVIVSMMVMSGAWIWSHFALSAQLGVWTRFAAVRQAAGGDILEMSDVGRYTMLLNAIQAIKEHPLIGTGFGTTRADTAIGPMVVHNSYLQAWADLGLIGVIGYVWLLLGWTMWLPRAVKRIRLLPSAHDRALYYNAIFLLIFVAVSALFHPISAEWSEWAVFLLAYALLWELRQRTPLQTSHA